jgi:hypothetical protein
MRTIFLEFQHANGALAANGTDVIFYLDGRWGTKRQQQEIYKRVEELRRIRSKYTRQLFVGYTFAPDFHDSSIIKMSDPNAPTHTPEGLTSHG